MKRPLIASGTFLPLILSGVTASAEQFTLRPRIEFGLYDYSFERDGQLDVPIVARDGGQALFSFGAIEFSDTRPFVGLGLTAAWDRFYVDLSLARSDGLEIDDRQNFSQTFLADVGGAPAPAVISSLDGRLSSDDLRVTDYSVSVGYAVSGLLSVYAGYRRGQVDTEARLDVRATDNVIGLGSVTYDSSAPLEIEFDKRGPFVGAIYGLPFEGGLLKGVLTTNLAVAFLKGDYRQWAPDAVTEDGATLPTMEFSNGGVEGDTVGLTLGFNWVGQTPLEGLSYNVGVSGYSYEFDADSGDDSVRTDFSETLFTYKLGLAYLF